MKTIGIVGLGLIGGSMAKAIKAHTSDIVLGLDINPEAEALARMTGAIDGKLTDERLSACDMILIAIAPKALVAWVEEKAPLMSGTLLVDLCGVKRGIGERLSALAEAHGFSYVGGHPMAGKEINGFVNSTPSLYKDASMILMTDGHPEIQTLDALKEYFLNLGFGQITFTTASEHDRIIAYTSQLAHIASSAYIKSPTAQQHMGFSAGSYRDMTRVAKLDENLWTELFLENNDYLVDELKSLIGSLNEYLEALESGNPDSLRELLRRGRELKATAGGN